MSTHTTTINTTDIPTVALAQALGSNTVHLARTGAGGRGVFTACTGRHTYGAGSGPASDITCKRCRKMVTL